MYPSHYNHSYGNVKQSNLSDCLYAVVEPLLKPPDVDVKLVDVASFFNMNPQKCSKTHTKYCDAQLTTSQSIDRISLDFDIYRTKNTKSQTRASWGKSICKNL